MASFSVNEAHNNNAKLEFMHGVSAGQTVSRSAAMPRMAVIGTVQVDDPSNYFKKHQSGLWRTYLKGGHRGQLHLQQ